MMEVSDEFSRLKGISYLDHAGATLYSEQQMKDIMQDLCSSVYGNPHSLNTLSKLTEDIVDQIRIRVLNLFNTNMDEYDLIFTSGTTSSLKLVAESFNFGAENNKGIFAYAQENHTSVLGMREIVADKSLAIECLPQRVLNKIFGSTINNIAKENCDKEVGNSLLVLPGQCNFSGAKTPLGWVDMCQAGILNSTFQTKSSWACLLDAASLVSTSQLDLSTCKPDFVTLSFYKIFGYPTGLGALLVKNESSHLLSQKKYYGGGTVLIALSARRHHRTRKLLHERFEDGTLPFLSVVAVGHGLTTLNRLGGSMDKIRQHTFSLARRAHHSLKALQHYNNTPVAILYCDNDFEDPDIQGPVVNFNLLQPDGKYVGYRKVLIMANSHKIQLRTGCFCNPGACQRHLQLTEIDVLSHYEAGHVCGDQVDLINGVPTGSVRISFGYMSTDEDVNAFLNMVYQCFTEHCPSNNTVDDIKEEWHDASENLLDSHVEEITLSTTATLTEVALYPIKSCGGFKPETFWPIGPRGLMYDRNWMIVSAAGTALTQTLEPRLALIRPNVDLNNKLLHLHFSGESSSVSVPLDETNNNEKVNGSLCQSKVCGDRIDGIDCGDEVAKWLSSNLGRHGIRLVRQLKKDGRSGKDFKKALALSNKAQFLMVSEESVSWLGDQIDPTECEKVGLVDRFRANLVLGGEIPPFAEKDWIEIKIGSQRFTVDGPCTRCGVVCVDQATGLRTNEPLRTLVKINQHNVHFGVYLSHQPDGDDDGIGLISRGNGVTVLKRRCQENSNFKTQADHT
ncbi:molybdenum cofactor sulfurase 3 [Frankliniella occidentalis]|uniref:Molybdenum cofactor sulfurase n=1 Tax=Frankliniella occidentalis TaxID=133901 RepID=A0A6J1T6X0_FRAOC|nr:molybdenum cofactor sulfurase 3 [Frankliniella occidentalis]